MYISTISTPVTIEELLEHVLVVRQITLRDRSQIMQAFLQNSLTEAEFVLIDRLLYGVRRGLLKVD